MKEIFCDEILTAKSHAILMFDMDLKMPLRKNVLSCFYKTPGDRKI